MIKNYSTHPVSVTRSARPGYGQSSRKVIVGTFQELYIPANLAHFSRRTVLPPRAYKNITQPDELKYTTIVPLFVPRWYKQWDDCHDSPGVDSGIRQELRIALAVPCIGAGSFSNKIPKKKKAQIRLPAAWSES